MRRFDKKSVITEVNQRLEKEYVKSKTFIENINQKKMEFDFKEVIKIAEYVRVASQSTPTIRTKVLVDEYLKIKNQNKEEEEIVRSKIGGAYLG